MFKTPLLMIGVCALLGAAPAWAATQDDNFIPLTTTTPPNSGTLTAPQFNDLGGSLILDSVEIFLTGTASGGSNGIQNTDDVTYAATVTVGAKITVTGPVGLAVITDPVTTNSNPLLASGNFLTVTGGTTAPLTNNSGLLTSGLAPYIGLGTINLPFVENSDFTVTAGGVFSGTGNVAPTASFTGYVEYVYHEAVPEPASLGILALGAVGLIARRRRVI